MSRLERFQRKKSSKQFFILIIVLVISMWFFLTYGIAMIVNSSVYLASVFGGKRSNLDLGESPEFSRLEISQFPTATNSATFSIKGNSTGTDEINLYINTQRIARIPQDEQSDFSLVTGPLQQGKNTISLKGNKAKSKEIITSQDYEILYKETKPMLEILSPNDGHKTPRDEITLSGKTDKEGVESIRIQSNLVVADPNGTFQSNLRLNEGENVIKITVVDIAGNQTEKEIKIAYEK